MLEDLQKVHFGLIKCSLTHLLLVLRPWSSLVQVMSSEPSHYLDQCCLIVKWTLENKLQWNSIQNTKHFVHTNAFENVIFEMPVVFFTRERWVRKVFMHGIYLFRMAVQLACCRYWPNNLKNRAAETGLTRMKSPMNTLGPRQNGRHFPDNIQMDFLDWKYMKNFDLNFSDFCFCGSN